MGWEASTLACRIPSLPATKLQVRQGWVATPEKKLLQSSISKCLIESVYSDAALLATSHVHCDLVVCFMPFYGLPHPKVFNIHDECQSRSAKVLSLS